MQSNRNLTPQEMVCYSQLLADGSFEVGYQTLPRNRNDELFKVIVANVKTPTEILSLHAKIEREKFTADGHKVVLREKKISQDSCEIACGETLAAP